MKSRKRKKRPSIENKRLIGLRERFQLSQADLGKAVDLHQSMISYIEAGKRDPQSFDKIAIVRFFNEKLAEVGEPLISVEWLFYEQINDMQSLSA